MWCYGVSSSLLVWITEIYRKGKTDINEYKKTHYKFLYSILDKNNYFNINKSSDTFLRKKGYCGEIWNLYYVISIVSISFGIYSSLDNLLLIFLETIVTIISLSIIYKYNTRFIYINILLQIILIIIAFYTYKNQLFTGYMVILQLLYNTTYYILKYKPQPFSFKFIVIKFFYIFERKIISEDIYTKYF